MEKNVEDSIKDGLIITITTTGIFFALKAANVKQPKASLDTIDIMNLAGGICGGVLVKDYAAYKNGSKSDTTTKSYSPLRVKNYMTPNTDPPFCQHNRIVLSNHF